VRRDHLVRIIERAKQRGELPAGVDAEDAVAELAGAVFYKRVVLNERIPEGYVARRVQSWLKQVGCKPAAG
jgi:hypothetical protein